MATDILFDKPMTWRSGAMESLRSILPGQNLYDLAERYSVTVRKNGKLNKGWVGQTLERVASLQGGNAQRRDGMDFELKSTSLVRDGHGWKPKETIKITQLSPSAILDEEFETSVLWNKLASLILVGCVHESPTLCEVVQVSAIDLSDPELLDEIRSFWEEIQLAVSSGEIADHTSSKGTSGGFIQLRGTGDGTMMTACPVTGKLFPSRAFYGTKNFVKRVLGL